MTQLWLLAAASLVFSCSVILQVAAADNISHIGIDLSNTCLTMLKNNVTTDCPTYDEILTLFPDTSNQLISGYFGYSDGIYQRQPTKFQHHFNFYSHWNNDVRWVDTPGDIRNKIRIITITSNDFEYKIPSQTITGGSLAVGNSRYVSSECGSAIITAKNWVFLLGDTVQHMLKNCAEGTTNFDEIKIKEWETKQFSIVDSAKYKLEQWQKEAIERCGTQVCKNEETKFNPEGAR